MLPCYRFSVGFVVFVWLIIPSHLAVSGNGVALNQQRSGFHYVIISSSVNDSEDPEIAQRNVDVLLDEDAFSEETLRKLYRLMLKRFPTPTKMFVWVKTNIKQVPTPEDSEGGKMSEQSKIREPEIYHWALLIRWDNNEYFRYNPHPPSSVTKTVVLKGTDPNSQQPIGRED